MVGRNRGSIETAETDLWFDVTSTGVYYIDIAQCLSLLNRRMYRQGMQYAVQDMEVVTDGVSELLIYRLPQTWVVASAWEKCMRNWLEQQNDSAEQASVESIGARYRDFKVYMDSLHAQSGSAANALPLGMSALGLPASLPTGVAYDWEYSEIVIPNDTTVGNTTERTFHMIGPDTAVPTPDSAGMIQAYAESRSRPQGFDPNTVSATFTGGVLAEMFDVGDDDEEVLDNYRLHNNRPPYPVAEADSTAAGTEYYPGGSLLGAALADIGFEAAIVNRSTAASGGAISVSHSPGFLASCGLVAVGVSHPVAELAPTSIRFKLGISPGPYKGVMARSMAVVN